MGTQPATMRGLLPLVTLSLVTPAPQFSTLQNRFEGFDFSQLVSDLKDQVKPKVDAVIWDISDKVRPGVRSVVDDIKSGGEPADVIRAVVEDLKVKVKPSVDTVLD